MRPRRGGRTLSGRRRPRERHSRGRVGQWWHDTKHRFRGPYPAAVVLVLSVAMLLLSVAWSGTSLVKAATTAVALADARCTAGPEGAAADAGSCPTTRRATVEREGWFGRRDITAEYLLRTDGSSDGSSDGSPDGTPGLLEVEVPAQAGRGSLRTGAVVLVTSVDGRVTSLRTADGEVLRTEHTPVFAVAVHLPLLSMMAGGAVLFLGTVRPRVRAAGWWRRPGLESAAPGLEGRGLRVVSAAVLGLSTGFMVVYWHGPAEAALGVSALGAVSFGTLAALHRRRGERLGRHAREPLLDMSPP